MPKAPFGERITIQDKCYDVRGLYRWIITDNHNILPTTQTAITVEEIQKLTQAYKALTKILISTTLSRNKLIEIYPNLQQETEINLSYKGYTDIFLGTFNNLPSLKSLDLKYNKIKELESNTFNNLESLYKLRLSSNQIRKLESGTFSNLRNLYILDLDFNQIQELPGGIFKNLHLQELNLRNNPMPEFNPKDHYGLSIKDYYGLSVYVQIKI